MQKGQENFTKPFFLLLVFYTACFVLLYVTSKVLIDSSILSEINFLNWDAMHYNTIQRDGYYTGMVAFFPLFPYIWKLTHLGSIGIGLLNGFIYMLSFAWLAVVFNIQSRRLLLLASTPAIIFMFLPFSESVFFLTSVILLTGLKKNNYLLIITGILLSGLTRPVATVFIPAFFILHWMKGDNSKKTMLQSVGMVLVCAGSMFLVFLLQYYQTGEWLSFIHVQKDWGNYLRLPVFPLNSWAGGFIVRLDAMAFLFGIGAAIYLVSLIVGRLRSTGDHKSLMPFLFSLCYLSILTIVILFTRGGILNSLNRYLFCSAFFMVAMDYILEQKFFNKKNVLMVFLFSSIFWLVFASYVHIQTLLKFEFLSLYLLLLFISTAENKLLKNAGYFSVLACNVVFMIIFFQRFLTGEWVG